jgi:hypothetical protein
MAALTNPHVDSDIGLLSIGGLDLTCAMSNASWNVEKQTVDVGGPCREGALNQTTGRQGTLSGSFYGASGNGFVTNYLDLSAVAVGGVTVKPQLYTLDVSGSFGKAKLPGFASGMAEGVLKKNYSGSIEMQLDDTDIVQTIVIAAEGSTNSAAQVVLTFTLNGVVVTFPVQLNGDSGGIQTGEYQKVTVPFVSQAPARGTAFPTAPTTLPGSPGLLDWALLSPRTNLAFTFTSKGTHGLVRAGYLTFDSFSFRLADGEITTFDYVFKTYGDWTTANNGAG